MTLLRAITGVFSLALLLSIAVCRAGGRGSDPGPLLPDSMAIRRDIEHLASNALEGRATGSPGNDSAARYIARRFQALGLVPLICDTTIRVVRSEAHIGVGRIDVERKAEKALPPRVPGKDCRGTYFQRFNTRSIAAAHAGIMTQLATQNVVGLLRGTDPILREQYVIVGAHHDHLGRMGFGVLDIDSATAIHNGADDNASGTAAVLEIARLLARRPPARSVIFVTFSGEELGLLGSQYYVDHSPVPLDSAVAMLNFDMVGRLKDDRLIVYGAATAAEFREMLDSANVATGLRMTATGDGYGASDHSSFYAKGLPVLHFFTDVHPDYHRSTDDIERINAGGEARIVALAVQVLREIANRPARLTFRRPGASTQRTSACRTEVALGTIPNMGAVDVGGLQLSGVREGSAGHKGGMRAGDIVVDFAGKAIRDIYDYQDALCSHRPGDVVPIIVKRDGQPVTLTVTLGKRGG